MRELRIVFMGTPEFAVPSLQILVESGYNIAGVITAPDRPKGRGRQLAPSPVKEFASKAGLTILQPPNLKSLDFLEQLKGLNANLQVVVAFRMLPEVVWNMPEIGTFNLHASLLPQYRGAAPINWAIINGETKTGVTTFFIKHEIDTGGILLMEEEPIHEDDNAGSLYNRLMAKGANLVLETVKAIERDDVKPNEQKITEELKHAPKIFTETCEINWDQPASSVHNFIRGLSPYPGAWMKWDNSQVMKIYKTQKLNIEKKGDPGIFDSDNKSFFNVCTRDGWIGILELQLQGKKRMPIGEFLKGNKVV